jgi:hypothetical protein
MVALLCAHCHAQQMEVKTKLAADNMVAARFAH